MVKNPPADAGAAGDVGSIPGLGRSPRVGNGKPPHYSCLENSMDRGAWQATVHGVTKSLTEQLSTHTCLLKSFLHHSGASASFLGPCLP